MGWSSLTPAETMSGSLVHPSARPQRKMVLENARRAVVTILGTCKYVMPLDLWAGDGHPAVYLSKSQAGTAGHDPPTPALLRTPAAARDSSGLRAPSGAWGPPLGPEDTNSASGRRAGGTSTANSSPPAQLFTEAQPALSPPDPSSTTPTGLRVSLASPLHSSRPAPLCQGLDCVPQFHKRKPSLSSASWEVEARPWGSEQG